MTAHAIFERQARATPSAIALTIGDDAVTYAELEQRANRLARHLRASGVTAASRVALSVSRGVEAMVSVLGILKAGAAYVPIDPTYPPARIRFMLDDSRPSAVVTEREFEDACSAPGLCIVSLDGDAAAIAAQSGEPLHLPVDERDVCYVIYTSGSTGRPKAVAMPHGPLVNLVTWQHEQSSVMQGGVTLQFSPLSFDVSFQELFTTWRGGGSLVLVAEDTRRDARALVDVLDDQGVERIFLPFIALRSLAEVVAAGARAPRRLRCVVTAGEQLVVTPDIVALFERLDGAVLHNHYGPSEAHVVSSFTLEGPPASWPRLPPIGRAIANTTLHVLDEQFARVAPGTEGELYIGGACLADGYLGRPDLTAERFVPDPFTTDGGRLYRTGDRARVNAVGELEYIGRADDQVKVRGYRIELGEIEAALGAAAGVRESAVVVRDDGGDKRLVAYVVAARGATLTADLHAALKRVLPHYMVPSAIVVLDTMPLTPSGKLDRKALPAPDFAAAAAEYVAPRDATEAGLAAIFRDVLRLERVGIHDDFFALGGHSLRATQVVARIRSAFETDLAVRALFEAPTIALLADRVRSSSRAPSEHAMARVDRAAPQPASFAQARLWFLDQLDPNAATYNVASAYRLEGALDFAALERSLRELVARHEALRTTFVVVDGEPHQVVHASVELSLRRADAASEEDAGALISQAVHAPFDLARGPVFRATLVRRGPTTHVLVLCIHHVATDGWSMEVLMRELSALYRAFSAGEPSPLAPVAVDYLDFSAWQRSWLSGDTLAKQVAFWKAHLAGAPVALELPTDRPRPAMKRYRGGSVKLAVPPEVADRLYALCRREGATPFMVLLAAYQTLLSRWSRQQDIVVGTPIANRTRRDLEDLVGFFVNTLALRTRFEGADLTFRDVVGRVKRAALAAYAHQDVPFEKLVDELRMPRDASRTPLFQAMFVMQNTFQETRALGDLVVRAEPADVDVAKFDLTLVVSEREGRLSGVLEYDTALFDRATIERFARHFVVLLEAAVAAPETAAAKLPLMSDSERENVRCAQSAKRPGRGRDTTIHELFEEQAARTPDAIAVALGEERVSYAALDARANRLAHHLRERGVVAESLVGLCVDRSVEMVIAILATLKAGGAYLPLDPTYPADRLEHMTRDSGTRVVITQAAHAAKLPDGIACVIQLDVDATVIACAPASRPSSVSTPEALAYVIYTSGSTGRPKGTLVTHRNVARLFSATNDWFHFGPKDVWTLFHSYAFDFSVWEIWGALLYGGCVVVVPYLVSRSPKDFYDLVCRERVTVLNQTPSAFHQFMRAEEERGVCPEMALRWVIFGGEALDIGSLAPWFDRHGDTKPELVNMYGITETTVHVTYRPLRRADAECPASVIGRPIPDLGLYVLEPSGELAPVGVAGELHVAGEGLSRGYLGRPELTAQRFIPDPFSPGKGRLYRTGDLARLRADGDIEYLGRIDHQVKIRGFRIELGEIEAALNAARGVRESIVIVRDDGGDKRLVAYVVAAHGATRTADLRAALKRVLPDYMLPSAIVVLEALPLTSNGKIDRKALPAPDFSGVSTDYLAPRDEVETTLARIFGDVLRLERVGVHDDFFAIGGHSLRATQVVARIRSAFEMDLPVRALFEAPTVAALAARVRSSSRALSQNAMVRVDRAVPQPASFAQARLWFMDQLEPGSATYNVPMAVRLRGALDRGALDRALRELVARHEALRTTFVAVNGEPHQVIHASVDLRIVDLTAASEDDARALVRRAVHAPFDLARGPIMRASLIGLPDGAWLLVLCTHHVATDGWSMDILTRELTALYGAFAAGRPSPLAPAPLDYADFAAWQRSWLRGEPLAKQVSFWREHLSGAPAALELPTDRPRPVMKQYAGDSVPFHVPRPLAERVHVLCRHEGATPFMVLLAAYQAVLARWSGQADIVVGTAIANRTRQELEGIVGYFVNMLALRTSFDGTPTFEELVGRVKQAALAAYAHQDLPFEKLVDELRVTRDTTRTPVFQAMFVMQNHAQTALALDELSVANEPARLETSKVDLSLRLEEGPDGFRGQLEYDVALFDRATIERFATHFVVLLDAALSAPHLAVAKMPLLGEDERRRLLVEWNATSHQLAGPQTVHGLFEAQVDRTPDAIAVACDGVELSYRALDARANQIANALLASGVGVEERVAVEMDRSADMLAAMLGVMKAGAAYLPVDPALPADRRSFMKEDAGVAVTLDARAVSAALAKANGTRPTLALGSDRLAYVLYTSGSTGRPKGTMIEHGSVVNLLASMRRVPGISAADTTLSLTTISFDVSVAELFLPLVAGAKVVIGSREVARDPRLIAELIESSGACKFGATPATWRMMVDSGWRPVAGMEIHCAGEALPSDLADALLEKGASLWNLYGPTEATVYASGTEVRRGERITIGRPLDGTRLYVLDEHANPVPTGIIGELYIAGAGVARGYLGRPELTAEKFVPDPFSSAPGARMYRTGDLVRWLADGNIDYLGRIDHQVKIRGYRIELGEIEVALSAVTGVEHSVVLAREDVAGDKRLVAYVVAEPGTTLTIASLKSAIGRTLPNYMIPSAFVMLDALPLSSNGKVDRKALPAPDFASAAETFVEPETPTERGIADAFKELLRLQRVGANDDFFALGGHSLIAIRLVAHLRDRLGVSLPVRVLFEAPTVRRLAAKVDGMRGREVGPRLERVAERHRAPLSYNQQMWWRRQQRRPGSPGFNYVHAVSLRGALDFALFSRAVDEVTRRHDSLRTTFELVGGEVEQTVLAPRAGVLQQVDLSSGPPQALDAFIREANAAPLQLLGGPPLPRATLLQVAAGHHVLVFVGHRMTLDHALCEKLFAEVMEAYQAFARGEPSPLVDPSLQYVDFVAWQRKYLETPELREKADVARRRLADARPVTLPFDRPDPPAHTTKSHVVPTVVEPSLWRAMSELARSESTTQFVVVSALFKSFLATVGTQLDITIIAPNELTRGLDPSLSSMLGCFFDFFVLRTDLSGSPSLREVVRREHAVVVQSQREVDVPCMLVTDDYIEGPLWQVALNFVPHVDVSVRTMEGLAVEALAVPRHRMVDLAWAVFGTQASLFASVDKFDAGTVADLAGGLVAFLTKALRSPDAPIDGS